MVLNGPKNCKIIQVCIKVIKNHGLVVGNVSFKQFIFRQFT